jgi:hypothetical protein
VPNYGESDYMIQRLRSSQTTTHSTHLLMKMPYGYSRIIIQLYNGHNKLDCFISVVHLKYKALISRSACAIKCTSKRCKLKYKT